MALKVNWVELIVLVGDFLEFNLPFILRYVDDWRSLSVWLRLSDLFRRARLFTVSPGGEGWNPYSDDDRPSSGPDE